MRHLLLSGLLLITTICQCQNNSILDNGIYQPFKGSVLYDGRSQEDILKDITNGEEPSTNLNIKYSDFVVTIYNYGVYETAVDYKNENKPIYPAQNNLISVHIDGGVNRCYLSTPNDSILLNEWVFNDLSNKLLKITPLTKEAGVHFTVSASLNEVIRPQFPRDKISFDDWVKDYHEWKQMSSSKEIRDSANYYFRIPEIQTLSDFPLLKKQLALRDTLVIYEGEYDDIATIVYKNMPSHFVIDDIVLRVDKYKINTLIETKYIRIIFSYGC